jgi:hypothetical protein
LLICAAQLQDRIIACAANTSHRVRHLAKVRGTKELNLALADVRVLADVLHRATAKGDTAAIDEFSSRALSRVWKTQHFSYWMTAMLHRRPGVADFDTRRQVAELDAVTSSDAGRRFLAEAYTGWPSYVGAPEERSFSSRRRILPVGDFGIASTASMLRIFL